jgi:5'-AMP-activated protein kinase regulatory beta subunit
MGNANGREDGENGVGEDPSRRSNGESGFPNEYAPNSHTADLMTSTPPGTPGRSRSPVIFAPQVPVAPLQRDNVVSEGWQNEDDNLNSEDGVPTLIMWNSGGNDVAVEGSWDNWRSRKMLQKSGKDHSILLVLPSGIYHYKFIVDGEVRYIPDLPSVSDEMGRVCNVLDVHDYVPENLESVAEFEAPSSPDSSYSQSLPGEEDFAKEPVIVPAQLHVTVLGSPTTDTEEDPSNSPRPQHVVLNHLYIEKGWASQSVVALGLTHRFESKYVTVVLYKPLQR